MEAISPCHPVLNFPEASSLPPILAAIPFESSISDGRDKKMPHTGGIPLIVRDFPGLFVKRGLLSSKETTQASFAIKTTQVAFAREISGSSAQETSLCRALLQMGSGIVGTN